MNKIKEFFIRLFRIPYAIHIDYDNKDKTFRLWTNKNCIQVFNSFKGMKTELYNIIVDMGEREFNIYGKHWLVRKLYEPERDIFDI